jgi:predicted metal-binding protein
MYSLHQREYMGKRGGWYLLDRLLSLSESWQLRASFVIQPVECLSACKRPCAVALAAPHKTTLMFGDLPPLESAAAVLQLASQYYNSTDGIVPRQERPEILQKGILARIPPFPQERQCNYEND